MSRQCSFVFHWFFTDLSLQVKAHEDVVKERIWICIFRVTREILSLSALARDTDALFHGGRLGGPGLEARADGCELFVEHGYAWQNDGG